MGSDNDSGKMGKVRDPLVALVRWVKSRTTREKLYLGILGGFLVRVRIAGTRAWVNAGCLLQAASWACQTKPIMPLQPYHSCFCSCGGLLRTTTRSSCWPKSAILRALACWPSSCSGSAQWQVRRGPDGCDLGALGRDNRCPGVGAAMCCSGRGAPAMPCLTPTALYLRPAPSAGLSLQTQILTSVFLSVRLFCR